MHPIIKSKIRERERTRYILGYWINMYTGWHQIKSFNSIRELVEFIKVNNNSIEAIDFIVER